MKPALLVFSSHSVGLGSEPKGIASGKDGLVVVPCINEVSANCHSVT